LLARPRKGGFPRSRTAEQQKQLQLQLQLQRQYDEDSLSPFLGKTTKQTGRKEDALEIQREREKRAREKRKGGWKRGQGARERERFDV